MQTLIKSIEDLTEDKMEYEISPGRVDIKYGDLSEKSKTLVDSFFIGICLIVDEFPEYVRIM
nr:MAG TPA: YsxB-like protein [Caudoviricetes sp.]